MLPPMTRPAPMAALLVVLCAALALWMPARAHAGDRAFYLAVVEAPRPGGAASPPGVMDAFVAALLECGETPLAACRAAHRQGSDSDTDGGVVLFDLPAGLALRDVLASATGQPAAGRAVRTALDATSIDAVVVVEHSTTGGAITVTAVWRTGRRVTRTTHVFQRANATPGHPVTPARFAALVPRLKRALSRYFVP